MLYTVAAAALALSVHQQSTPPTFATDFYVGRQDALAINQGGYEINNGICCSKEHSPSCKLQAMNSGGDVYEQGSQERSRSDSAQGTIVSWWGSVKKQMALIPGSAVNSTHAYACAQFCPLDGDFEPSLRIGDGKKGIFDTPKDKGQVVITQPKALGNTTKVTEHWEWTETILWVIPMQTTNMYVDMSAKPAAPFFENQIIKPFGQQIGEQNSSFIDYTPKDVSEYFDIDPASIANCTRAEHCSDDPPSPPPAQWNVMGSKDDEAEMLLKALSPHRAPKSLLRAPPSILDVAKAVVATSPEEVAKPKPLPPMPNITFVADFTAHENSLMEIVQGGTVAANGDPCCMSNSPMPQCQVQLGARNGMRYFDVTNQRARFEDTVANQVIVDDYKALKSMLINVTDGAEWCQEYCPIDPDDTLTPIDPFDPFDAVKDMGKTTLEGKSVEHYHWADKILKIITMQTTDFYADITNPKAAIPVFMTSSLTPFGRKPPIGTQNQTWSNFKPGTPEASKFAIKGVATCPKSSKCQQSSKQMHRFATGQLHTAARYIDAEQHPVMPH